MEEVQKVGHLIEFVEIWAYNKWYKTQYISKKEINIWSSHFTLFSLIDDIDVNSFTKAFINNLLSEFYISKKKKKITFAIEKVIWFIWIIQCLILIDLWKSNYG